MGNKMKIVVILIFSLLVYYFFDIGDCFRKEISNSDVIFLGEETFRGGKKHRVFGVKNVCVKKYSQYQYVLTEYSKNIIDTTRNNMSILSFIEYDVEVQELKENNYSLFKLSFGEFKEFLGTRMIFQVSNSISNQSEYEYSWFNSKLSEENKSLEELINEAAAPQLEK